MPFILPDIGRVDVALATLVAAGALRAGPVHLDVMVVPARCVLGNGDNS